MKNSTIVSWYKKSITRGSNVNKRGYNNNATDKADKADKGAEEKKDNLLKG